MEIVLAREEHKKKIWNLFVNTMKPYVENIWGWEIDWQINNFQSSYKTLNTSRLRINGFDIGYIQYELRENATHLKMLIIAPEHQNKNLGSRVLDLVQNFQIGKPLELRCFKINTRAIKFYLSESFEQIAEEDNFIVFHREATA